MGEETDNGRGPEDPFEGLDQFFAPIEAVRWPEGAPSGADEEPRGDRSGEGAPERTSGAQEPASPGNPAASLPWTRPREVPPTVLSDVGLSDASDQAPGEDWRRLKDVLGDDAEETVVDEPPALIDLDDDAFDLERGYATVQTGAVRSSALGAGAGAGAAHRASAGPDEPQAGGRDAGESGAPTPPATPAPVRERVSARPREESSSTPPSDAPQSGSPATPAAPPPSFTGEDDLTAPWPEPDIEEEGGGGGLTLEDLKKAPPEYRGLPGPKSPEPADVHEDAAAGSAAGPGAPVPGPPARTAQEPATGADSAPSLAEVEAMAENLAREFRSGPPQDDVVGEIDVESRPAVPAQRPAPDREPVRFDDDLIGEFEPPEPPQPPPPRTPRTVKVGAPEDLTGPAWEDPTARTVTREKVPPPPRERDLPMAVITAAVLIAAALLSIALSTLAFAIVATVVIVISQAEFYAAAHHQGYHPATLLGLVAGAMVAGGAYFHGEAGLLAMSMLALVATFLWFMATPPKARTDVVANAGVTLFGMLYIAVSGSFYLIILKSTDRAPRALVLAILGLTFLYDVAAFFIGRYWGRHPLAPTISPRKSVQGLIGATFVTLLVASVLPRSFGPFDTELKLFALGLTVVIFAPLGDLAESLLKRDLGIKDMGSILPGHGGMLDRIDSAIFVGPAVFYLIRLIS